MASRPNTQVAGQREQGALVKLQFAECQPRCIQENTHLMGCSKNNAARRKGTTQMDDVPLVSTLKTHGACSDTTELISELSRKSRRRRSRENEGRQPVVSSRCHSWKGRGSLVVVAWAMVIGGCKTVGPVRPETVSNRLLGPVTIAVAPAVNLSGSADFDPNRFADLMASELSFAEGVRVIPVSRVLGVLAAQRLERVESAVHAEQLARWVGADAILIFAVTEYDPYDPPSIGISAQLFGARPRVGLELPGPVDLDQPVIRDSVTPEKASVHVLAESQRVYDASHERIVREIRLFARQRNADESPYGWRRYVVDQQRYMRFCCHATVYALLAGGGDMLAEGSRRDR